MADYKRNKPPILMTIDYGQAIAAVEVMDAAGKVMNRINDKESAIYNAMLDYFETSVGGALDYQARNYSDKIAHVYQWSKIIDVTSLPGRTKTKSRFDMLQDYSDSKNDFKAFPMKNSPLFYMRRTGTKSVSRVFFMDNPAPALIDEAVVAEAKGELSSHHFKDQAFQLETMSRIIKDSSKVSKRRTSGKDRRQPNLFNRRISQGVHISRMTEDGRQKGFGIANFGTYRRRNPYYKQFEKFWLKFVQNNSEKLSNEILEQSAKAIIDATSTTMQKRIGAMRLGADQGGAIGASPGELVLGKITTGMTVVYTNQGKIMTRWPEPKEWAINSVEALVVRRIREEETRAAKERASSSANAEGNKVNMGTLRGQFIPDRKPSRKKIRRDKLPSGADPLAGKSKRGR